jgi:hypothetical protein
VFAVTIFPSVVDNRERDYRSVAHLFADPFHLNGDDRSRSVQPWLPHFPLPLDDVAIVSSTRHSLRTQAELTFSSTVYPITSIYLSKTASTNGAYNLGGVK